MNLNKVLKYFEKGAIALLLILISITIIASMFELAYMIVANIFSGSVPFLDYEQLKEIFGFLLIVLIGFELLETIKSFLSDNQVRIEVILIAAILAIARKVIFLDFKELSGITLIGLALIILALTTGYFLIKKVYNK